MLRSFFIFLLFILASSASASGLVSNVICMSQEAAYSQEAAISLAQGHINMQIQSETQLLSEGQNLTVSAPSTSVTKSSVGGHQTYAATICVTITKQN